MKFLFNQVPVETSHFQQLFFFFLNNWNDTHVVKQLVLQMFPWFFSSLCLGLFHTVEVRTLHPANMNSAISQSDQSGSVLILGKKCCSTFVQVLKKPQTVPLSCEEIAAYGQEEPRNFHLAAAAWEFYISMIWETAEPERSFCSKIHKLDKKYTSDHLGKEI